MDLRERLDWLCQDLAAEIERHYGEVHGYCAHAALVGVVLLRAEGQEAFVRCGGYDADPDYLPQNHAWIEVGALVGDPTRWQFPYEGGLPPLVYAPGEPGYELYVSERRWHGPHALPTPEQAFELLGEWGDEKLSRFLRCELETVARTPALS